MFDAPTGTQYPIADVDSFHLGADGDDGAGSVSAYHKRQGRLHLVFTAKAYEVGKLNAPDLECYFNLEGLWITRLRYFDNFKVEI